MNARDRVRLRIVHAYWDIDTAIVWRTASERIPALGARIQEVLDGDDTGEGA